MAVGINLEMADQLESLYKQLLQKRPTLNLQMQYAKQCTYQPQLNRVNNARTGDTRC